MAHALLYYQSNAIFIQIEYIYYRFVKCYFMIKLCKFLNKKHNLLIKEIYNVKQKTAIWKIFF